MIPQGIVLASSRGGTAATPITDFVLNTSVAPSRSTPFALNGASLAGNRFIFLTMKNSATAVIFWLDDVAMTSTAMRTEKAAPWDFRGTADNATAVAWNTATVAP